jgi:hypothetical protein
MKSLLPRCTAALLLCALPPMLPAETARLQAGTHIALQLVQHITSGHTPAGSPVYFRVKEDMRIGEAVVVRKGTLVRGQMTGAAGRGAVGASGNMNFGVRFVPAVDGQNVRVIASLSSAGRDRSNALVGWTILWGWFGLITKGADAYALRGAELDAEVLSDKVVEVDGAPAVEPAPADITPVALAGHVVGTNQARTVSLDFERFRRGTIRFTLPGAKKKADAPAVSRARITAINDLVLPEPVESDGLTFDLWQVLRYCDEGDNHLVFRLTGSDGAEITATYALPVKFVLRKKA